MPQTPIETEASASELRFTQAGAAGKKQVTVRYRLPGMRGLGNSQTLDFTCFLNRAGDGYEYGVGGHLDLWQSDTGMDVRGDPDSPLVATRDMRFPLPAAGATHSLKVAYGLRGLHGAVPETRSIPIRLIPPPPPDPPDGGNGGGTTTPPATPYALARSASTRRILRYNSSSTVTFTLTGGHLGAGESAVLTLTISYRSSVADSEPDPIYTTTYDVTGDSADGIIQCNTPESASESGFCFQPASGTISSEPAGQTATVNVEYFRAGREVARSSVTLT